MYHTMFCYGLWLSESYSVKVYHFNYNSISSYSVTELNFDNECTVNLKVHIRQKTSCQI